MVPPEASLLEYSPMQTNMRFLPCKAWPLLIFLTLIGSINAQNARPFSSLSVEEAKAALAVSPQRLELMEVALESRRLDLVKACFEDINIQAYLPDAVLKLQDTKFAGQVNVMMLRCPSIYFLDGMAITKGESFRITLAQPLVAAIRHAFPDVEFKAVDLLHSQTRLRLADQLEAVLNKTRATPPSASMPDKRRDSSVDAVSR